MFETAVIARSPIEPARPITVVAGWEVSARRSTAGLRISDQTPLTKIQVRAAWNGAMAKALAVPFGRAARDDTGALVVGSGPGEWLVLAAPGMAPDVTGRLEGLAAAAAPGELVTVVDYTHARALVRITGERAADLLAKVCAVDFSAEVTPDGAAFRSSLARVVTDIVRDDEGGTPSYLLHCERSFGQYLFDAVLDAGDEFGIEIDGFRAPEI